MSTHTPMFTAALFIISDYSFVFITEKNKEKRNQEILKLVHINILLIFCNQFFTPKTQVEFAAAAAAAKSLQSCLTLCDPIDSSPPGSPVPGILQARTLEWVAISFSNAWKWKVKAKSLSRVRPSATPWTAAHPAPLPMGPSRQEYRSGLPLTFIIFSVTDEKVNLRCYKIGKDSLESSTRLLQVVINGVDTWKLQ